MLFKVCAILFVLVFNLRYLEACNGYSYTLNAIQNCNDDSVIKVSLNDFNTTWDDDCNINVFGCLNITKTIKIVKTKYIIIKDHFPPLRGEVNLCDIVGQSQVPSLLQILRIMKISKCPVSAINACAASNNKISIAQYKNQLGFMVGTTSVKLEIMHDVGKTCVDFNFTVDRARNV